MEINWSPTDDSVNKQQVVWTVHIYTEIVWCYSLGFYLDDETCLGGRVPHDFEFCVFFHTYKKVLVWNMNYSKRVIKIIKIVVIKQKVCYENINPIFQTITLTLLLTAL